MFRIRNMLHYTRTFEKTQCFFSKMQHHCTKKHSHLYGIVPEHRRRIAILPGIWFNEENRIGGECRNGTAQRCNEARKAHQNQPDHWRICAGSRNRRLLYDVHGTCHRAGCQRGQRDSFCPGLGLFRLYGLPEKPEKVPYRAAGPNLLSSGSAL